VKKLELPLQWEPFHREFPLSLSHKKNCLKSREQIRAGNRQKYGSTEKFLVSRANLRRVDAILGHPSRFSVVYRQLKRHFVSYLKLGYSCPGNYGGSRSTCHGGSQI
jgi:hypothetical protein